MLHLKRFQADHRIGSFVKNTSPISVMNTLDLSAHCYNRTRNPTTGIPLVFGPPSSDYISRSGIGVTGGGGATVVENDDAEDSSEAGTAARAPLPLPTPRLPLAPKVSPKVGKV